MRKSETDELEYSGFLRRANSCEIVRIFNGAGGRRVKRAKRIRIEWNNVSLAVDVAVCSHFAHYHSLAHLLEVRDGGKGERGSRRFEDYF